MHELIHWLEKEKEQVALRSIKNKSFFRDLEILDNEITTTTKEYNFPVLTREMKADIFNSVKMKIEQFENDIRTIDKLIEALNRLEFLEEMQNTKKIGL